MIVLKRSTLLGILLCLLVLAIGITLYVSEIQITPLPEIAPAAAIPDRVVDVPKRIIIPSIGLDAKVQSVGLTANGDMGVPNNFTDTAWYNRGPKPGERGTSLIDGHEDNGLGLKGVFKHLDVLKEGDLIHVIDATGATTTFRVIATEVYDYKTAPTGKIFGTQDTPGKVLLNLITCAGDWVPKERTKDSRLVIYSEMVTANI